MNEELNEKQINKTKGLYITGTLGCIIGACVGAIPWMYALYTDEYIAPLALFIGVFADVFYRLAYGKRRWKKIFVILPVCMIVLAASTLAADGYHVYSVAASGALPAINAGDLKAFFHDYLFCSDEYVFATLHQVGYAAIFALVGSMTMWVGLKGRPGKKRAI